MNEHDINNDGLHDLLHEKVMIWCTNYIYTGVLEDILPYDIKLSDPRVIYDTGSLTEKEVKYEEPLPGECWYVRTISIESYGKCL